MEKAGRLSCILLLVVCHLFFAAGSSHAGGSASKSYAVPTSVFSGGGGPMGSANFNTTGTIGQSSPLMDPADPPYSFNYDLYPGYWYTLEGMIACGDLGSFTATFGFTDTEAGYNIGCDSEPDGDVDGVDLAGFADGIDNEGGLTLPYSGSYSSGQAAFWVSNNGQNDTAVWDLAKAEHGFGVIGQIDSNGGAGVVGKHSQSGNLGEIGTLSDDVLMNSPREKIFRAKRYMCGRLH